MLIQPLIAQITLLSYRPITILLTTALGLGNKNKFILAIVTGIRSEERRVGKEC